MTYQSYYEDQERTTSTFMGGDGCVCMLGGWGVRGELKHTIVLNTAFSIVLVLAGS